MQSNKKVKELAKKLGIIRKRSSNLEGTGHKRQRRNAQPFGYLIVIDFESTCWKDAKHRTQEIIEFPAVLLNTTTGEVESEFHHYVQPVESPTLSEFCKELTGITQYQVDQGIPIVNCLTHFTRWLQKLTKDKGVVYHPQVEEYKTCTFVTWSDWDLGVCLQYECRRKQLRKPKELNCWIDLRSTYRKFYERRPNGLNGALQDLGIKFEGREHSGLDDARNTAKLAWRMICDGCVMRVTKALIPGGVKSSHRSESDEARTVVSAPTAIVRNSSSTSVNPPDSMAAPSASNSTLPHQRVVSKNNIESNHKSLFKIPTPPSGNGTASFLSNKSTVFQPIHNIKADSSKSKSMLKSPTNNGDAGHKFNLFCTVTDDKYKTPTEENRQIPMTSSMRKTPPMCKCGKRSKRKFVQSPGPNVGRVFYCCSAPRGSNGVKKSGCGFFQWEKMEPLKQPDFSTPQVDKQNKILVPDS